MILVGSETPKWKFVQRKTGTGKTNLKPKLKLPSWYIGVPTASDKGYHCLDVLVKTRRSYLNKKFAAISSLCISGICSKRHFSTYGPRSQKYAVEEKNNHLVFLTYQKKSTLPFKFTPQGRNMNKWFILYDIRRQQRYLETRFANQKPALAASERAFSLQLSSALSSSSHMVLDRCLSAQKAPDLNIFGKWGGWATFLCKEPFPPHQLGGAFDISSLPSPWKCCTCNHPSPLDCNQ